MAYQYVKKTVYLTKPCKQCGKLLRGTAKQLADRVFCSWQCNADDRKSNNNFMCVHCGIESFRRLSGTMRNQGWGNKFCSMKCRKAEGAKNRKNKEDERHGLMLMRKIARMLEDFPPREEVVPPCQCVECSMMFMRMKGRSKTICEPCLQIRSENRRKEYNRERRKTEKGRANKLREKTLRRARHRVDAESISPMRVFELNKWKCQACGCKTPKKLRGSYDDKAPELDHIISLADGGTHTWGNVQCLCRACNASKSARSIGQLSLGFK